MSKSTLKRHPFTLIEVMVAMGVLAILMMFTLQFFSGTQRLWADAESKNEVYSDARVAMDFISTQLQNIATAGTNIPFALTKNTATVSGAPNDRIYFCSNSPIKLNMNATSKLYFLTFQLNNDDQLAIGAFGDNQTGFANLFYSPTINTGTIDAVVTSGNADICSHIIGRVTGLEFIPYDSNMTVLTTSQTALPYAISIRLTLLDSRAYEQWKGMNGSFNEATNTRSYEFRKANERTFTRTVFLGDRSYTP